MDEYWKRSGQIPAFGNWDFANELPITQYFESARQAGLLRYSSSSGETDPYVRASASATATGGDRDLYALDFNKPVLKKGTRNRERRCPQHVVMVKDNNTNKLETGMNMRKQQQQGKVYDVTEQRSRKPINKKQLHMHTMLVDDAVPLSPPPRSAPKPVDEDLYKIPPELLRKTKRKKMLGFISKCLVPAACVS